MGEYIVSARKYRPMSFASVVGQQALTTTLMNAVKSKRLAHAYLFCGPRGVGKTTCARIFAKAINCEHPTEQGEACNECESCKAFNEGRSYNIFELDAASNNSVENIKALMDQNSHTTTGRTIQGFHNRRGAHAIVCRLQCLSKNAGRTASTRYFYSCYYRKT